MILAHKRELRQCYSKTQLYHGIFLQSNSYLQKPPHAYSTSIQVIFCDIFVNHLLQLRIILN